MLGHPHQTVVTATSKKYGFSVKGKQHVCPNCALAKSKKKNVPKTSRSLATEKGERISIDISSVNTNSFGKNKFWLLIQDEFTGHIWSEFIMKKSQLPQVMLHWIYKTQKEANVKIMTI
jgi:23S rRNA A1618 N6-methylase RlmF